MRAAVSDRIPEVMLPEEIISLFNTKEVDEDWSFARCKPSDTGKWTHDYHRYPAKFIPQLVEKLIDEYISSEEAHINDPFMGCGTTIVTAISRGFKASGTDINKIAYLITKVKSTPIEPEYLNKKIERFLYRLKFLDQTTLFGEKVEPLIPQKHRDRIDYWFTEDNKNKLGKILRIINDEDDENIRDFFSCCFQSRLKKLLNVASKKHKADQRF